MNFLLEKGTDISAEVLKTEIVLLQKGLRPSIFFRFPGLVSGKSVFMKIVDFGLIPLGSDAWLSKGQKPGNGSIVLIHANGNDPYGIRIWTALPIEDIPLPASAVRLDSYTIRIVAVRVDEHDTAVSGPLPFGQPGVAAMGIIRNQRFS